MAGRRPRQQPGRTRASPGVVAGAGQRRPGGTRRARRAPPSAPGLGRRGAPALGARQRARARSRRPDVLDHRLDQHAGRPGAGAGGRAQRRARTAALCAAADGSDGTAAAAKPVVGASVRGLHPRARHAVGRRGRCQRVAGDGRAADVRLHVRRRRPGSGDRRCRRATAPALADGPPVRRRRPQRCGVRAALRQRVQPAPVARMVVGAAG